MRAAPITDLKNRLSHYLRLVARGETVTVLDRGVPVAQITPVSRGGGELGRLAAEGLVRLPLEPLPGDFLTRALPRSKAAVSRALDQDRGDRF
jgi:prevent-host-death family protein